MAWVVRGVLVMMVCGVAGNMHVCVIVCVQERAYMSYRGERA